jgi:hypothetical protein
MVAMQRDFQSVAKPRSRGAVRPVRGRRQIAGARASARTLGATGPGRAECRGAGGANRPLGRQRVAAPAADAAIVATRREGKFITLADEAVLDLMSALRRIAEQNIAEVERVP